MPRVEQITVNVVKGDVSAINSVKTSVQELKKLASEIKIGDVNSYAKLATAEKNLATAALNRAKADKEAANAANIRAKAEKTSLDAATARLKLEQQQAKTDAAKAKSDLESAKAKTQMAKAEADLAKAEESRAKAQQSLTQAQLAKQNASEKEALALATQKARLEKETANALTAESKMYVQAEKQSQQRIQQAQREAKEIEKAYQQIKKAQDDAYANRANTPLQNQIDSMLGIDREVKSAKESMDIFVKSGVFSKDNSGFKGISDGAKEAAQSVANLGKSAASLIKQLVGFYGAAQSLRYAFNEMKNMSDEMVTYRKVTGATADEMERIRTAAYDTAKKYGQSPSDFLASASEMARAGYGENSVAMAELATQTQLVGDMTAEAASKFLLAVDAGYQYHGSIEKLTHVLDAANEVDNNFATSIEKISEGMTLVASLGGQAGVPIEELIAALGTMTAATQRSGGEMARALRSIFLNVLKDTSTEIEEGVTVTEENIESLSDALNKYGDDSIKAAQKAGKLINPMQAIAALAKAFKEGKLLETDLFEIGKSVAGQRYYNAFAALIANWDTLYEPMLEKIQNSAGSAEKEYQAMLDSWTVKTEQLKTTWVQMVNESINEGFIKNLIDGGTQALEFAGSLGNLATMATGAYTALKSLSAGLSNLSQNKAFGGFNIATAAIGAGIAAIGYWKSSYENHIKEVQEAAMKAVQETTKSVEKFKNIEEIKQKYDQIASDGIQAEKGELEELQSLQSQLNSLVGEQAGQIDLVNGKYEEQKAKLAEIATEQKKQMLEQAQTSRSMAVAAFGESDLNGFFNFGSDTGIRFPDATRMQTLDWLKQQILLETNYFRLAENAYYGMPQLEFTKPENDPVEIIQFLKDSETLLKLFGNYTLTGEEAGNGIKSIGEEFGGVYTALQKFVTGVRDAADPVRAWQELMDGLQESLNEYNESASETEESNVGEGAESAAESFDALAESIKKATDAKKQFDDAMKTTKADGFNDYKSAFETFEKEIKEGRVNSTAMYAAARMMLGDEVYNAAGGTYEGVMAAMNTKGAAGSRLEAYKILYGDYRDAAGNKIEGYGAYELMRQSGLWTAEQLTDKNGNPFIPDLSSADMQNLSQAWGGILVESFVNALNALDQYDTKGEATDAAVKAVGDKKDQADEQVSEAADKASESAEQLSSEVEKVGEAAEQAGEQISQAADSITESKEKIEETAPEETEAESATPDLSEAQVNAEVYLDTLTQVQNALKEIGSSQITGQIDPNIAAVLGELNSLKEAYNIDVSVSASSDTKMAASLVGGLVQSLQSLENKKKVGAIEVGVAEGAEAALKEAIRTIIENTTTSEELDAIELVVTADGTQADEDITALITKQRENIKLKAEAETDKANKDLDAVADKSRTATIKAQSSGVSSVESELNNLARDRQAKIEVFYSDDGTEHTGLSGTFASGTRDHPGGLSLVNDGDGPELLINNGRAFIANGGKPALVNLQPHAKVFTASETRSIFSGNGVPAYADGTFSFGSINLAGGAKLYTESNSDKSGDKSNKGDSNNSGDSGNKGKKDSSKDSEEKDKAWSNLTTMMDFILNQIDKTLDKQIQELQDARDAAKAQNELEKKQEAVAKAQADLADALNNRTVRYLGEDGKWHWQADARNVKSAQESLKSAEETLKEYEEETAFNEKIKAMKADFNKLSEAWEDIKTAVNTPTGSLSSLISAVLSTGSPQEATGANAVQNYLISQLINGKGIETQYNEALYAIQRATNGNPIMPGEGSIADLISQAGAGVLPGVTTGTLTGGVANGTIRGRYGVVGGAVGSVTNNNYYVNGVKIGREEANSNSLSGVLSKLGVYTNTVTVR